MIESTSSFDTAQTCTTTSNSTTMAFALPASERKVVAFDNDTCSLSVGESSSVQHEPRQVLGFFWNRKTQTRQERSRVRAQQLSDLYEQQANKSGQLVKADFSSRTLTSLASTKTAGQVALSHSLQQQRQQQVGQKMDNRLRMAAGPFLKELQIDTTTKAICDDVSSVSTAAETPTPTGAYRASNGITYHVPNLC